MTTKLRVNDLVWSEFGYAIIQDLGENLSEIELQQETQDQGQSNEINNHSKGEGSEENTEKIQKIASDQPSKNIEEQEKNQEQKIDDQNDQDKSPILNGIIKENGSSEIKKDKQTQKQGEKNQQGEQQQKENNNKQEELKQQLENGEQIKSNKINSEESKQEQSNSAQQTNTKCNNQQQNQKQSQVIDPVLQKKLENQIVKCKLKFAPFVSIYVPAIKLKKIMSIYVKTFFGSREKYHLKNIDINTSVSSLKKLVIDMSGSDEKLFYNRRLIYPMAFVNILSDDMTLASANIPANSNLILMVQQTFFWDPNAKGSSLTLTNNSLTVKKIPESESQVVLGNLPIVSGKCYFEVKIEYFTQIEEEGDDLLIGVARKEIEKNQLYSDQKPGLIWAYMPLRAEKIGPDLQFIPFGFKCKKGDTIGVLLEFKGGLGHLNFYRNKEKCNNPAFSNLTGTFYPAISFPYGEFQVTLDPKASLPINL